MVTSASISIADARRPATPFHYLERQLFLALLGLVGAAGSRSRDPHRGAGEGRRAAAGGRRRAAGAGAGAGPRPRRSTAAAAGCGSAGMNLQVSEVARVLVLVYVASYAVRRETNCAGTSAACSSRSAAGGARRAAAARAGLRRGHGAVRHRLRRAVPRAARGCCDVLVLVVRGSLALAVAGAIVLAATACGASRLSSIPGRDPFNSGFQLTQSLIAIGRGEWFGVGLGESVQKLFYLPEAHTDFLFAVLAEEFGLVGVRRDARRCSCAAGRGARSASRGSRHDAGPAVPVLPRRGVRPVARHAGVRSTSA